MALGGQGGGVLVATTMRRVRGWRRDAGSMAIAPHSCEEHVLVPRRRGVWRLRRWAGLGRGG